MVTPEPPPEVLSVKDVAQILGLTPRAVLHRINRGAIRATKLGEGTAAYVITRAEVDRVLATEAAA